MDDYRLVLGLPHTNHLGLAEHLLLMYAGHCQWTSIAKAIGRPLSTLRTLKGSEVYATFFFIEERFPPQTPISAFRLDDAVRFAVFLRAFKSIAVEGQIVFDHESAIGDWLATHPLAPSDEAIAKHPYIRFGNIFITPEAGNSRLKVASPAGGGLVGVPNLSNEDNPYHLTKRASETGVLGLIPEAWPRIEIAGSDEVTYAIDIDRDTNGAGLVYFANYVVFMDGAERQVLAAALGATWSQAQLAARIVEQRRVAYYGNVAVTDRVRTRVQLFACPGDASRLGIRYEIRRGEDQQLVCLSEAIKCLGIVQGGKSGRHEAVA